MKKKKTHKTIVSIMSERRKGEYARSSETVN